MGERSVSALQLVSNSCGQSTSNGSIPVPVPKNHIENGREFHGFRKGIYMYPCDEVSLTWSGLHRPDTDALAHEQQEKDRMDIFHKLYLVARKDQLHRAPLIPNWGPPRILDLGTGTGIWAIDMAE